MIGTSVLHYKVTSRLGEGGMGEVWRAEDTRLGRDVALKVLSDRVAGDTRRLERFAQEARLLAALSHPNIAGVHGFEDVEGRRILVMELAEGETLARRLARGPLLAEDAAPLAEQIAEALEAAHERGIVHRDLKPGNVMVGPGGQVKVLDFGLAKALGQQPGPAAGSQDWTQSPTLAPGLTQDGMLLGTASYMSPEQARGKPVDARTDIWAFGCVLFEMLSGRRAFRGETVTDILGAIVHQEPPLDQLPASIPPPMRSLIWRCLQKDPSRRLQSIGDARVDLQYWVEHPESLSAASLATPLPTRSRSLLPWAAAVAGALLGGILTLGLWGRPEPSPEPVRRSTYEVPESRRLLTSMGASAVLSPDGRRMAFVVESPAGDRELLVRPFDRLETTSLASGPVGLGPYHPFFSPDGEWLGYVTQGALWKVSVTGGAPIELTEAHLSRGASWGPDGRIVISPSRQSALALVSAGGGDLTPLTTLDTEAGEFSHRWPQWLPGGHAILFTSATGGGTQLEASIEVVDVSNGERTVVHRGGYYARYVPTGHVLYVQDATLFALPFDARRLEVTGTQMPVVEGIEAQGGTGAAQFDVSHEGTLVYTAGSTAPKDFSVVWADRQGTVTPLLPQKGIYGTPALSPDGRRLALAVLHEDNWDVWTYDLERGQATRLTFGERYDADPVWSPDGKWIAFSSDREGPPTVFRKRSDGSGVAERLHEPGLISYPAPMTWSADGETLVVQAYTKEGGDDLVFLRLGLTDAVEPFQTQSFNERMPSFSADGRWIAYVSNETGRSEVYVSTYPPGGGKWQISDTLGSQPQWSRSGRELYYRTGDGLMVVDVNGEGPGFRAGQPRPLFSGDFLGGIAGVTVPGMFFADYDAAADGRRFVMFAGGAEEVGATTLQVVTGWFTELQALTGSVGS